MSEEEIRDIILSKRKLPAPDEPLQPLKDREERLTRLSSELRRVYREIYRLNKVIDALLVFINDIKDPNYRKN